MIAHRMICYHQVSLLHICNKPAWIDGKTIINNNCKLKYDHMLNPECVCLRGGYGNHIGEAG